MTQVQRRRHIGASWVTQTLLFNGQMTQGSGAAGEAGAEPGRGAAGVADHLAGTVAAVGTADAAAGVGAGAAEVEVADRGPVVGVPADGPERE